MNVVSSWKVKVNFAHVKPHASNLLFVGLLWASGPAIHCLYFEHIIMKNSSQINKKRLCCIIGNRTSPRKTNNI